MTDRGLLVAAAKAAGIDLSDYGWRANAFCRGYYDECESWNPLTDDGDALRLAVRLDIGIQSHADPHGAYSLAAFYPASKPQEAVAENHGADPYAATRRAIVRAAAAMGTGGER